MKQIHNDMFWQELTVYVNIKYKLTLHGPLYKAQSDLDVDRVHLILSFALTMS